MVNYEKVKTQNRSPKNSHACVPLSKSKHAIFFWSENRKFLRSFRDRKCANFWGVPVRNSQLLNTCVWETWGACIKGRVCVWTHAGWIRITDYLFYCKRAILFLSSSKILTPHPPLRQASLSSPRNKGGGYTLAGRRGGWGVNILEDERNRIALLQ